ncbi:MAG TPA: YceI family protein [Jiangellaceae bacterium]|nr:YceI family protein [Jiangellaceae bacterium]
MKRRITLLVATLGVVLLGAGGIWWFLRDDAPAEVSLDAATESVAGAGTTGDGANPTASGTGAEGTWTVDTATGDFDYESATGTFAGFRIEEELTGIGSTTAVGRTGDVTGSITIEGSTLTAAELQVELTTITTNDGRRDDRVQEALETGTYPTATFTLTEPIDLGDAATTGQTVSVVATGDLTIHGETRQVEIPIDAQLVDDTIVLVASTDIVFSDFGVDVPDSPIVLSVDDQGVLEVQLLLARA